MITVPISEGSTVGEVSDAFMRKVARFEMQDIQYGIHSFEYIHNLLAMYTGLLQPDENGEVSFESALALVKEIYPDIVYDKQTQTFYDNEDVYKKHLAYAEGQRIKQFAENSKPGV